MTDLVTQAACVITGLPGSGKSTVACGLATALNWPLFDKDDFLEKLYKDCMPANLDERRQLSRKSDAQFRDAAVKEQKAILVSHWASPQGPVGTGTCTSWIAPHFRNVVEIHCACSPQTATDRFHNRTRHPGHLDRSRSYEDIAEQMQALAQGYPLRHWPTIEIRTETRSDLTALAQQVLDKLSETR